MILQTTNKKTKLGASGFIEFLIVILIVFPMFTIFYHTIKKQSEKNQFIVKSLNKKLFLKKMKIH